MAAAPGLTMVYEPLGGQLLQLYTGAGVDTRFAWSGGQMISEINASNWAITKRYVPGPGTDEPVVWYEGSGTSDRRWLHADERGSVVAVSDGSGTVIAVNRYDEYGIPASTNIGRFQYTGQAWLPELGMYYYKARMYSPTLGRFMQTDPIGYGSGMNLYSYVTADPVNLTDPTGLKEYCWQAGYSGYDSGGLYVGSRTQCLDYEDKHFGGGEMPGGGGTQYYGGGGAGAGSAAPGQGGCTAAGAAARARANATASQNGPSVAFDTPSEIGLLEQYFRGDTTPYRLSSDEFGAARAYVAQYGDQVMGPAHSRADGLTERHVYFGSALRADSRLDGLLGTATGVFRGGSLVGIRDTFNFDFKWRGYGEGYGLAAMAGVAAVRLDALSCAGDVKIPVGAGVQ
jgi:RHS repeat-associated protein